MTRRALYLAVLATFVAGGAAATVASADTRPRHAVCVETPGSDPMISGYCVTWSDPIGATQ